MTWDYGYDANSNRTSLAVTGQPTLSYAYSATDRLTSFTGGGSVGYDSHGNTTSIDGITLGWDAADRNMSLVGNGITVTYQRDATDRIRSRTQNGATVKYLYDDASDAPVGLFNGATVTEWPHDPINAFDLSGEGFWGEVGGGRASVLDNPITQVVVTTVACSTGVGCVAASRFSIRRP